MTVLVETDPLDLRLTLTIDPTSHPPAKEFKPLETHQRFFLHLTIPIGDLKGLSSLHYLATATTQTLS